MLEFTKMQGLGNDFVVIDATRRPFLPDAALLTRLADRRFGVGCDQILVVDPPPADGGADFGYRIYNADGSEVGQCGNGARCLARYVREHHLSDKSALTVRTRTSVLELQQGDDGQVRVNMGVPRLAPADVPLRVPARTDRYTLAAPDGRLLSFGAVSMGNPHAVIEVDDVVTAPVAEVGAAWQHDALFPERVNVGFVHFVDRGHARLRVFERGAGETLACGSGACAAAVIGRLWDRLDARSEIRVNGGTLAIEWAGEGHPVWMTGPAESVYEGRLSWPK